MVPDGWRLTTLGEAGAWLSGGTPSKRKSEFWNGEIPWVSPKDMKVPRLTTAINMVSAAAIGNGTRLVDAGALLVVVRGMILAHSFPVALTTRSVAFNQDIKAVVPRDGIDSEFLLYWLEQAKENVLALVNEATHGTKRVPTEALQALRVGLPPLGEQQKIAAILSSVDEAIERTEAVIDQVQVVKKALMQELLTRGLPGRHTRFKQTEIGEIPESWEARTLVDLGGTVTSGSRGWARFYADIGHAFIRITNLQRESNELDLDDLKRVQLPIGSKEGRRTKLTAGDLLISITAELGLIGWIPPAFDEEAYINQHIALVRLDPAQIESRFVAYFLSGPVAQKRFGQLNDPGAKAGLNLPTVRGLVIPVPSREEQVGISEALGSIDARRNAEREKLDQLTALKASLSAILLSGEVRVQVDDAETAS